MATLAQLVRIQSQLGGHLAKYLEDAGREMSRNVLLEDTSKKLRLSDLWQPLRCTGNREHANFFGQRPPLTPDERSSNESEMKHHLQYAQMSDGSEFSQPATNFIKAEKVEDFLRQGTRVTAILGDPGSGKTELLKRRVYMEVQRLSGLLQGHSGSPDGLCPPVFVSLKQLPSVMGNIEPAQKKARAQIREQVERGLSGLAAVASGELVEAITMVLLVASQRLHSIRALVASIARYWTLGSSADTVGGEVAVLCLDGWDEVQAKDRAKVAQLLAPLLEANSPAVGRLQVILSSRVHGYESHRLDISRQAYLMPFQVTEVEFFIRQFCSLCQLSGGRLLDENLIIQELRNRPGVLASCANPFVVTLLCRLCCRRRDPVNPDLSGGAGKQTEIPDTRCELYDDILNDLLGNAGHLHSHPGPSPMASETEQNLSVLADIAAAIFPEPAFSEADLAKACGNRRATSLIENNLIFSRLDGGGKQISFLHLTFQEYLTAVKLVAADNFVSILLQCACVPSWTQVVRMAIGLASLPAKVRSRNVKPKLTFEELVRQLSQEDRQPCPGFASLLLASAAADMGKLSEAGCMALCETWFSDWCLTLDEQTRSTVQAEPIQRAFYILHRGNSNRSNVEQFFERKLDGAATCSRAALLMRAAQIYPVSRSAVRALCQASLNDDPALEWPVHTCIAQLIGTPLTEKPSASSQSTALAQVPEELEQFVSKQVSMPLMIEAEFRSGSPNISHFAKELNEKISLRVLLQNEETLSFLGQDVHLTTMVGVIFGGFNFFGIEECQRRLEDLLKEFVSTIQLGRRYAAARELDLQVKPWLDLISAHQLTFDPAQMFIQSGLDGEVCRWLSGRFSRQAILMELNLLCQAADRAIELRADALLASVSLAPSQAEDFIQSVPEEVIRQATRQASLRQKMLRDVVLRAAPLALSAIDNEVANRTESAATADAEGCENLAGRIHQIHRVNHRFGGRLAKGTAKIAALPAAARHVAYAELVMKGIGAYEEENPVVPQDYVYNLVVMLDTIGRPLSAPSDLLGWLSWLPFTSMAQQESIRAQILTTYPSFEPPDSSLLADAAKAEAMLETQMLNALDTIYRCPPGMPFFQGWALACLAKMILAAAPAAAPRLLGEMRAFARLNLPQDRYSSQQMVLDAAPEVEGNPPETWSDLPPRYAIRRICHQIAAKAACEGELLNVAWDLIDREADPRQREDMGLRLASVCRDPHTVQKVMEAVEASRFAAFQSPIALAWTEAGSSLAERVIACAARIDHISRQAGGIEDADALWSRLLKDPANHATGQRLRLQAEQQGFLLTGHRAALLAKAMGKHRFADYAPSLRLVTGSAICAKVFLKYWHSVATDSVFRDWCSVLLLEASVMTPEVARDVGHLLESPDDLMRQRTQHALLPNGEFREQWRMSVLGAEPLLIIAESRQRYNQPRREAGAEFRPSLPGLALHLSWFLGTVIFDDPGSVRALHAAAGSDLVSVESLLLKDMRRMTSEVFCALMEDFAESPEAVKIRTLQIWESMNEWTLSKQESAELASRVEAHLIASLMTGGDLVMAAAKAWARLSTIFPKLAKNYEKAVGAAKEAHSAETLRMLWYVRGKLLSEEQGIIRPLIQPGAEEKEPLPEPAAENAGGLSKQEEDSKDRNLETALTAALLYSGRIDEALKRGRDLSLAHWVQAMLLALDSPFVSDQLSITTLSCARLALRKHGMVEELCCAFLELMKGSCQDPRWPAKSAEGLLFPRSALLTLLDACVSLQPRVLQEHAPAHLDQLGAALQLCIIEHNTFPGRRAALGLLAALQNGLDSLIEEMKYCIMDASIVVSRWLTLYSHSEKPLAVLEKLEKSGSGNLRQMLAFWLLANSKNVSEQDYKPRLKKTRTVNETMAFQILCSLRKTPDNPVFWMEPTGEYGGFKVLSSVCLHHRIARYFFERVGLIDRPLPASQFGYVACDIARSGIFTAETSMPGETLRLYLSERPPRNKRVAEFQLRYFTHRIFGSQYNQTQNWFLEIADKGWKSQWKLSEILIPKKAIYRTINETDEPEK